MIDFSKAKQYIINLLESDLSKGFLYHDLAHTLDVFKSATRLGEMANLDNHDLVLLKTAALFHDVGLIFTTEGHEKKGVEVVKEVLPEFGYNPQDIEIISGSILATQIPQNPKNMLEKLLCDADLDYLGRDDFFILAAKLQLEWRRLKIKDISFDEWLLFEKGFLAEHEYFTPQAQVLRNSGKKDNLDQIKNICRKREEFNAEK